MRAVLIVLAAALAALWAHYAWSVAPAAGRGALTAPTGGGEAAAELNAEGVRLARRGRAADALAYFQRAHDLFPESAVVARNLSVQRARVSERGWRRALIPASATVLLVALAHWIAVRIDRSRLRRIRLEAPPRLEVGHDARRAELALRLSGGCGRGLFRRHPLTIVWSSAQHGKHMKSRPPVRRPAAGGDGREWVVELDGERLERLRRHPGLWNAFLYLGRTPLGRTAVRIS